MTWPLNKFLLPAGFLPPVAPLSDFKFFEKLRTGGFSNTPEIAAGYEYYFMINQDPEMINKSLIGGKIRGVHGPWLRMNQHPSLYGHLLYRIMFLPRVAKNAPQGVYETAKFAKAVGANYIVIHTSEIDFEHPIKFITEVHNFCTKNKIKLFLEPEGKSTSEAILKGPVENWHYDHLALYNKFKIPIVYDPATVEMNGQDILKTWSESKHGIGHIHLNEFIPGFNRDHGVMKSSRYTKLLALIAKSKYKGFFTFEQDSIQTRSDFFIAALYTACCFLGLTRIFTQLPELYAKKTQKYLHDSVIFSEKNLIHSQKSA